MQLLEDEGFCGLGRLEDGETTILFMSTAESLSCLLQELAQVPIGHITATEAAEIFNQL